MTLRERLTVLGFIEAGAAYDRDQVEHQVLNELEARRQLYTTDVLGERDPNEDVRAELEALRTLRRAVLAFHPSHLEWGTGGEEWSRLVKLAEKAR